MRKLILKNFHPWETLDTSHFRLYIIKIRNTKKKSTISHKIDKKGCMRQNCCSICTTPKSSECQHIHDRQGNMQRREWQSFFDETEE